MVELLLLNHYRVLVRCFKLWVLDFSFCQRIITSLMIVSIPFLMRIDELVKKFAKKTWVLAPTFSKTMGALAPTAPILTKGLVLCSHKNRI